MPAKNIILNTENKTAQIRYEDDTVEDYSVIITCMGCGSIPDDFKKCNYCGVITEVKEMALVKQ